MGLFDWLKRKKGAAEPPPDEQPDEEEAPVIAVAVVREGMSLPSDDDMRAVVEAEAPEHGGAPRHGLAQPVWWRQEEWVAGGLRGVARALARQVDNDPDQATWRVVKDERGARVGLVFLRR